MKKFYSLFLAGVLTLISGFETHAAKTVPYSSPIAVTSSEFDDGWTQIDANNDADGQRGFWGPALRSGYSNPNSNGAAARYYSLTGDAPADDYLVSPAIHLEANTEYMIMYGIATESTSYPKDVYLYAATTATPEAFKANQPLQYLEQYKDNYFKIQSVTYTPTQSGDYYFAIYTNSPNQNYYLFASTFAVYKNEFAPAGVTNLKAERNSDRTQTECTLSWTLPTKSTFGEDFTEAQTVQSVNLYRDGSDRAFKTLQGAQTTYTDTQDDGLEPGIHTYEVEVVVAGAVSPKVSVTSKYIGPVTPASLPYTWLINDADTFDDWTVAKGSQSQNTNSWERYTYGTPCGAKFACQTGKAEDDYLIAPPFAVTEPGYYKVTVSGYPSNAAYSNKVELRYGTAPSAEAMTSVICDKVGFTKNSRDDYSYVVRIDNPGTYYFAAVATNPTPDYGITIYVYSIGVEATEKTPAPVTGLTATPGVDDALEVILNWTCPTQSSNGEALTTSEYTTQIYKGETLLATLDGGVSTYTDKAIEQPGVYTYTVKTLATGGANVGGVTITSKWVGPHLVALPYATSFKPDDTTVAIWDIVDANDDSKTWHYYSNSYRCTQSDTPGEADGTRLYNDYFLSPHFELTPGYYKVTFKPLGGNATKPMTHNVGFVVAGSFIAERPELQQPKQYTSTTVSTYSAQTETYLFKIEEAGRYQVVFAAIGEQPVVTSTSDSYSFYGFTEFTADAYPVLPTVATDLTITAAQDEVLEATLSWMNPTTTNVEGVDLDAITKAVIIRDGQNIAEVTTDLTPGQTSTFVDNKEKGLTAGPHTYAVEIYNASGKSNEAAPTVKLDWVGGGLDITEEGVVHTYAEFDEYYTFIDVHNNQKSSYDGWSIAGTTAMKVDETNSEGKYDDWAVSPRFNIKKDGEYELKFETYIGASYRDYAPYTFEVYVGAGEDTQNYTKIGEVTSSNKDATASNPETTTIYIKGVDVEEALLNALAEGDEVNRVDCPAGSLAFAFRATQKGGVFVKTFTVTKTYEPEEVDELPEIPERAEVIYADGKLRENLNVENWYNAAINFTAANPTGADNQVLEFKAGNLTYDWGQAGYTEASMGLNMVKPANTGIFHDATLNFGFYPMAAGAKYTVRLTATPKVCENDYNFTITEDQVGKWNTMSLKMSEVFPEVAQEWEEDANFGEGYVFSIIISEGTEDDVMYLNHIYYTDVDTEWEAPEHNIPAPETVPVPEQDAKDVVSVFSSAYEPATGFTIGWWGQSTVAEEQTIADSKVYYLRNFNYLGWELTKDLDVTDYDYLHVDYWTADEGAGFGITPVTREGTVTEKGIEQEVALNEWNSYDVALSDFAEAEMDLSTVFQIKFDYGKNKNGYIANVYFWKEPVSEPEITFDFDDAEAGPSEADITGMDFKITVTTTNVPDDAEVEVYYKKTDADDKDLQDYEGYELATRVYPDVESKAVGTVETTHTFTLGDLNSLDNVYVKYYAQVGDTKSGVQLFSKEVTTGVEGIALDSNSNARYFNLQGVEISNPASGTVVIRVEGNTVSKVRVK